MTATKHREVPCITCPGCGGRNDMATSIDAEAPHRGPMPGDVLLCFKCGAIVVVDDAGMPHVRRQSPEEFAASPPDVQQTIQRARQLVMDKNFIKERVRAGFAPEDAVAHQAEAAQAGMVAVLGAARCADGPPPRKMRPARKVSCGKCKQECWVSETAPTTMPIACAACLAKMMLMDRGA